MPPTIISTTSGQNCHLLDGRERERETATGSLEIGSAIAARADFEDLRTRSSVSDLQSATRQKSRMGTTIPGRRKKKEQDQIFNISVSIWALQVTPKARSGKITMKTPRF